MLETEECASCILDLHSKPTLETAVSATQIIELHPISRLESSGPFEFINNRSGNWCSRPSHYKLYGKIKIVNKKDGTPVTANDVVSISNNLPGALFKQIDYEINGTVITQSSNDQQYRTYMELLLSYNKAALKTHKMATSLWTADLAGQMDETTGNTGWLARKLWINDDKTVEFFTNIHIDMCSQPKCLPPGVQEKFKFIRGSDTFCLIGDADKYKVEFQSLILQTERILPSDTAWLSLQRTWLSTPVNYPLSRVMMRSFTIPKGTMNHNLTNIFSGQAPTLVAVAFVGTKAYNGAISKNPYNFQHYKLNYASLNLNNEPFHNMKPLTPDFEKDEYIRAYYSLFSGTGIHHDNESLSITKEMFKSGYMVLIYDTTPDLCNGEHIHPRKQGTLNLELRWKEALPDTINVLIYASFQNSISISNTGEVTSDFSL